MYAYKDSVDYSYRDTVSYGTRQNRHSLHSVHDKVYKKHTVQRKTKKNRYENVGGFILIDSL